jgi:hypothetical protein
LAAGAFLLGAINTNSCPAGSSVITAAAQCQAAATALGLRDGGTTNYGLQPRGCAKSASLNMVEYNSHASGAADPDYTPICAAAGARGCRYAVLSFLAAPTRGHLARPCVGMACSVHLPCVRQMQARWPPRRRIVRSPTDRPCLARLHRMRRFRLRRLAPPSSGSLSVFAPEHVGGRSIRAGSERRQ